MNMAAELCCWQGGGARTGGLLGTGGAAARSGRPSEGRAVDSPRATSYTPAISEVEAALLIRTHNSSGHDPAYYWPDPLLTHRVVFLGTGTLRSICFVDA
ncbi:hypothetical protein SAMN04488039_10914 [Sulfitobacter dubius]|nr:hypothetical protein SAMN04488039_10914 [Sulfitobacter dubius]